jgi:hypothetical protein
MVEVPEKLAPVHLIVVLVRAEKICTGDIGAENALAYSQSDESILVGDEAREVGAD